MSLPPEDAALRDFFDSLQSQGYCLTWVAGRRIDLSQGPIKSVEFRDGIHAFDVGRWNTYEIIFDVTPDYWGIPALQEFSIQTHGHFRDGRYVDVGWVGNDMGLGVIDSLNTDGSLKAPLLQLLKWRFLVGETSSALNMKSSQHGGRHLTISYGWWEDIGRETPPPIWSAPSIEVWNCLEKIGQDMRVRPPGLTNGIGGNSAILSVPAQHQIAGSMSNGLHVAYDIAALALWSLGTLGLGIFAFYSAIASWDRLGGWGGSRGRPRWNCGFGFCSMGQNCDLRSHFDDESWAILLGRQDCEKVDSNW